MSASQPEGRRVLAISAHPDDAEFTSGGSIARWQAEGWIVHLAVCTDGSKGSHDPAVEPARLAARRQEEQRAAAETLGIADVVFLNHPDGELNGVPDLVAHLTWLIRRIRPHRLLSWDPWRHYELHPDHRAAGLAALDAVLATGNPHYFPPQLAEGLTTHQVPEVYLYGADEPDAWVDVTATFERKLAALACHRSQVARLPGLAEDMQRCNARYGRQKGYTYAEAFKVLHPFCDT
ncbi:MAG TPA: PIG-L family deacetylase [Chloroflexi bacterium]|nr:PIG-L family deacetylase [Chloroflexota bacterium]